MQYLSDLKLSLIERIMSTNRLEVLEEVSRNLASSAANKTDPTIAFTTIRTNVTLDELLEEQAYQPVAHEAYLSSVASIEWSNSLEELLSLLD